MTSMARATTAATRVVIGGVDTHGQTHHAAVIDEVGRELGDREFPASPAGYRALAAWLGDHGELERVGVEGTGTYGAALARYLRSSGITVVEVDRPDRKSRRAHGKSDPLDAYAAARAVLSGAAAVVPKLRDGRVEAIRALRVARSSAVKARSQATNQIKALIVTGPAELREQLRHLRHADDHRDLCPAASRSAARRPRACHQDRAAPARPPPPAAVRRDRRRRPRSRPAGPRRGARACSPCPASGRRSPASSSPAPATTRTGSRSEAAFAHLCGVAPIPASSGRVHRHRLNRGGDRGANNALLRRRPQPAALRPTQPRLRRTPHPRRTLETRDHQMPETLRRPRDLQRPLILVSCRKPDPQQDLTVHRTSKRQGDNSAIPAARG